jgi:carbon storage regulator
MGEEIVIGQEIVLSVLSVKNGRVRLGISAPREVPVVRRERAASLPAREAALARTSWS